MSALVFLHTAAIHVQNFDALLRELAPGTRARHIVRDDLLTAARRHGADDDTVAEAVAQAIADAASSGDVVLCTCSTIGGLAERAGQHLSAPVLRVDRPMVEEALRLGSNITVAAALESTLSPTESLIRDVAIESCVDVTITPLVLTHAWPLFEQGDLDGYHDAIASALARVKDADAIVLAQASMAGAIDRLDGHGVPILSSPLLGVRAALTQANAR